MQETATFSGGCFWCTEAIFKRLKGVLSVTSGYTGGNPPAGGGNPSYEDISSGTTGHAEAVQIVFDPAIISFDKLLSVFFATHDPTTLNRQGADSGTQYRSAVFYHSDTQKEQTEEKIAELTAEKKFKNPIVTQVDEFSKFYEAEEKHKNFYDNNRLYPYCQIVIDPKVRKLIQEFRSDLKEDSDAP